MDPQREPVSRDEYLAWKTNRVTKQLVADLLYERQLMLEEWAEGRCGTQDEIHRQEGRVQKIKDIVLYIIEGFRTLDSTKPEEN